MKHAKPTKEDLRDAVNRKVDDLIDHNLKILFCGINPGLYSGATGFHFARPGNRFWKVLHLAGFTDRQLDPSEEQELLENGYGITCFVERTTARADEIDKREFMEGGKKVEKKIKKYKPKILAVLGIGAYRSAFNKPKVKIGRQDEKIGDTQVWLLPNPSGLNANYQIKDFVELFKELRKSSDSR